MSEKDIEIKFFGAHQASLKVGGVEIPQKYIARASLITMPGTMPELHVVLSGYNFDIEIDSATVKIATE